MTQYEVDDDLALRVEQLTKRKPFEILKFNEALGRVVDEFQSLKHEHSGKKLELDLSKLKLPPAAAFAHGPKKAPSPRPS